jgi:hypothetical protein
MKVAIFSESPADDTAIRVLINGVLSRETDEIGLPFLQGRGWPSVKTNHPAVLKYLHYQTETEALVIVVDLDDTLIHEKKHEQPNGYEPKCRLCFLRESTRKVQSQLRPRGGRAPMKIAVGLAMPAIEAWYLNGIDPQATEAMCIQGGAQKRAVEYKNKLKEMVYKTSRPSLSYETQRAVEEAQRLAQNLSLLEQNFPIGFGSLVRDLRNW